MFLPKVFHRAQSKGEALKKPIPNPYDMDVVTGPSGPPKNKRDDNEESSEGGGWLDGTMN